MDAIPTEDIEKVRVSPIPSTPSSIGDISFWLPHDAQAADWCWFDALPMISTAGSESVSDVIAKGALLAQVQDWLQSDLKPAGNVVCRAS